ncbi:MAG: glutathione S-transferase family protein, partial [Solirubrobacterales bacterium]|nr:glutathione S-transferase family protein [Solirubrobacterales bacterium]
MERLRLYDYAASANCYKVRLLLAQLGLEYERRPIDIFAGDTLTAEYAAINPARTTPVLEVGEGHYLPESNAILLYLAEGTEMLPGDRFQRAQVYRWLLFEQADVVATMGGLRFRLATGRLRADAPGAERRRRAALETLKLLDDHLTGRDFAVGERYGVADIALYGYVHVAHEADLEIDRYPA